MTAAKDARQGGRDFNDPDRQNAEQNEEGTQAQDVARDALRGEFSEESEPGGGTDGIDSVPRDMPDLVSRERAMLRSGKIDMDAYAGEERMDGEDK